MESLTKIEKELGYTKNSISRCCLGKVLSAHGYIWSYEKRDDIIYYNKNLQKQKKIYQFSKDMEFIKVWNNLETIENSLGYERSSISACCRCVNKTAYGYIWRYEENLDKEISLVSAQAKKVLQLDRNYNIVAKYNSLSEAQKVTGINNISACCTGKYKTAGGFIWIYEENYNKFDKIKHMKSCTHVKEVDKYDLDMNYLETFKSVTEAANSVNGYTGRISMCCKGKVKNVYGFIWKYKNELAS